MLALLYQAFLAALVALLHLLVSQLSTTTPYCTVLQITDMMPDEAQGPSTSTSNLSSSEGASDGEAGTKSKGRGLWVALGLTPPDMEAFVKEGVEEITL